MNNNEKFMTQANHLALQNVLTQKGGPFGCVIAKDGEVIAEGANSVTGTNDPTAHAEIVAIRKACEKLKSFQLTGCVIYTSCEPCPMCLGAIYWARPDKVYFAGTKEDAAKVGFDDAFIYEEINTSYPARKIPFIPLMNKEAQDVFKAWAQDTKKVEY